MIDPSLKLFVSAVTGEFCSYRDSLRRELTGLFLEVKVQKEFVNTRGDTLSLLDDYIGNCHAVIHLIGDATGAAPMRHSVEELLRRHPDFAEKTRISDAFVRAADFSYTQWEAYLAIYHRRELILYQPDPGVLKDAGFKPDPAQRDLQEQHRLRLQSIDYWPSTFLNRDNLNTLVLRSIFNNPRLRKINPGLPGVLISAEECIQNYHLHVSKWREKWSRIVDGSPSPTTPVGLERLPPFIATQRFLLLKAFEEKSDPCRHLEQELTNPTRDWESTDRMALFFEKSLPRVCVTTDAGLGKTTTLKWLEWKASAHDPHLLALYVRMRELPTDSSSYLRPDTTSVLIKLLRSAPGNDEALDGVNGARILRELIRKDRLLLLVDALDQTGSEAKGINSKVTALRDFLRTDGRNCRVVITGRPHAIRHYCPDIFDDDRRWRFVRMEDFSTLQQIEYLGQERHQHLKQMDVALLAIPRALEIIRELDFNELKDLSTAGDIFWKCVEFMLKRGVEIDALEGAFSVRDARWLLAVLAFGMVCERNFEGIKEGDLDGFHRMIWEKHVRGSARGDDIGKYKDFDRMLRQLAMMNEGLDSGFLEGGGLYWRNRSLQEFFAGLWLAHDARSDDSARVELYLRENTQSEEWKWVWRFAAEIPVKGRDESIWIRSMAPLYRPGDGTVQGTPRSCEMLCRSWPTMREYATKNRDAEDLINRFREPFQTMCVDTAHPGHRLAVQLVKDFCDCAGSSFKMGKFPITNQEYELFDPARSKRRDNFSSKDTCPVINVTWYDAAAFCYWLGERYRLPWQKEWEFACRAGSEMKFCRIEDNGPTGYRDLDTDQELRRVLKAHFGSNFGTRPVGGGKSNLWGLFDMHGNVWEWCLDIVQPGGRRAIRGGGWQEDKADRCQANSSAERFPNQFFPDVGFRVVESAD